MRLAIVRRRYTPFGGAERFIERLAGQLVKDNIELTIISEYWPTSANDTIRFVKIPSRGFLTRSWKFWSFRRRVNRYLQTGGFDLIQSHERGIHADIYRCGDGIHAAWLDRLASAEPYIKSFLRRMSFFHRAVLSAERSMANDSRVNFIVTSSLVREELLRYYKVSTTRISLIPNDVDTLRFYPADETLRISSRRLLNVPDHAHVVSFVGSGFDRKGLWILLEAIVRTRGVYLLIAGRDRSEERVRQWIMRHKLGDRVYLLGPVTDPRPILWSSDVFALPTLYDPFSNSVLEACACGLPIVASEGLGILSELVRSGAAVATLRHAENIKSAILSCLGSGVNASMRESARNFALNHSQDSVQSMWRSCYEKIIRIKSEKSIN